MPSSRRFTIRLGPLIEGLIEKYKGEKSKTTWIKEAILEKAERQAKLSPNQ